MRYAVQARGGGPPRSGALASYRLLADDEQPAVHEAVVDEIPLGQQRALIWEGGVLRFASEEEERILGRGSDTQRVAEEMGAALQEVYDENAYAHGHAPTLDDLQAMIDKLLEG